MKSEIVKEIKENILNSKKEISELDKKYKDIKGELIKMLVELGYDKHVCNHAHYYPHEYFIQEGKIFRKEISQFSKEKEEISVVNYLWDIISDLEYEIENHKCNVLVDNLKEMIESMKGVLGEE